MSDKRVHVSIVSMDGKPPAEPIGWTTFENGTHVPDDPPGMLPPGVICLCRDEDCPRCGWPETYTEMVQTRSLNASDGTETSTTEAYAIGCRKCGWRNTRPVERAVLLADGSKDFSLQSAYDAADEMFGALSRTKKMEWAGHFNEIMVALRQARHVVESL